MEKLAADIADATLREYADCLLTSKEVVAYKVYTNPKNWTTNAEGQMVFQPTEGLHFDMMPQKGYDIIYQPKAD